MALRNFWMEANIDGRENLVTGGARTKDGRMVIDIYQRDNGKSVLAFTIHCDPCLDGKELLTYVVDHKGKTIGERITER